MKTALSVILFALLAACGGGDEPLDEHDKQVSPPACAASACA